MHSWLSVLVDVSQVSKSVERLDGFSTVMHLYSKRAFTKDAKQWGKCVVKYMYDAYQEFCNPLLTFLIEVSRQ